MIIKLLFHRNRHGRSYEYAYIVYNNLQKLSIHILTKNGDSMLPVNSNDSIETEVVNKEGQMEGAYAGKLQDPDRPGVGSQRKIHRRQCVVRDGKHRKIGSKAFAVHKNWSVSRNSNVSCL